MKLEKRDVYIREFWSMSWVDRYIYTVVNQYCRIEGRELNPLKWSAYEILMIVGTIIVCLLIPFVSIYNAFYLKKRPMPDSKDPMFRGCDNWRIEKKWVVKR